MPSGDHIKVRMISAFKRRIVKFAEKNRTTVSALTRDALARSMDCAFDVDQLKIDMISVRRAANALKRYAEIAEINTAETSKDMENLAQQLKRISTRHMGAQ